MIMIGGVGEGVAGYCFLGSESQGANKKSGKLLGAEPAFSFLVLIRFQTQSLLKIRLLNI